MRNIIWFSCGSSSFLTAYLTLINQPGSLLVYCNTNSEHPDNLRFLSDSEKFFSKSILTLNSKTFFDVNSVIFKREYLSGRFGAPCTIELKKSLRYQFQLPDDNQYFGYTFEEVKRANNFKAAFPEVNFFTPLIDQKITKDVCNNFLLKVNIKPPIMYSLGFKHNNCIGCVKSSSPFYWSLVRKHFPSIFYTRLLQEKIFKAKLLVSKKKRFQLSSLASNHPYHDDSNFSCDFLCENSLKKIPISNTGTHNFIFKT